MGLSTGIGLREIFSSPLFLSINNRVFVEEGKMLAIRQRWDTDISNIQGTG